MKFYDRYLSDFICYLLFFAWFPFVAIKLNAGWGPALSGSLLTAIAAVGVAIGIFSGHFADRYGKRPLLLLVFTGYVLAQIMFLLSAVGHNLLLHFLAFGLMSWSFSVYFPISKSLIADIAQEREWKSLYATLHVIFNICVVLGPLLGGLLLPDSVWLPTTCLVLALVNLLTNARMLKADVRTIPAAPRQNAFKTFYHLMKDYRLTLFIIGSVLAAQAFMQMELLLPLVINHQDLNYPLPWGGYTLNSVNIFTLCLAFNGILIVLFTRFFARLSNHYSLTTAFVLSGILYAGSMLFFGYSSTFIGLLLGVIILTCAELLVVSVQDSFIAQISTPENRSGYFAAASIRFSISRIFAPQMIIIAGMLGFSLAFVFVAVLAFCSSLVFFGLFTRLNQTLVYE
ncbi:MFS transporter [Serratia fonticola]|uniref:MFS transporter n=1 Tax=Serratia fonticola TaxID=47917 RepID=UPI000FA4C00A|nr:MFS transporter [Serratia fonticola]NTY89135.1 MFS transporter [Serratia fonticola]NTZ14697.1 MFS transporter [Serratia fonticola]CAI1611460.1 Multidrug resistance protein MdtH [Serratia fonticola]HBE9180562.1 MFS transporter [Serratia fonticola]